MGFDRRHLLSALVGGLIAAIVVAALPALGANGDAMLLGTKNNATRATKLIANGGLVLSVGKAGSPALTLNVTGDTPPMAVNSSVVVDGLNTDLLDGMDAADFAGAVAIDEGLMVEHSKTIATVTGASLLFECIGDGGGGSTGRISVQALANDLHAVYRDSTTLNALQVFGWGFHNALGIGSVTSLFTWDPDKTKQDFLDTWANMYRFPLTVWSPSGGLIDGELVGLLSDAGPDDCHLTGYLIATG